MASQVSLPRIAPAPGPAKERRCCIKKCPNPLENQYSLFLCGNKKCTNFIHSDCYSNIVVKKAKSHLEPLKDPEDNNLFFCKVTCYRVGAKEHEKLHNPHYLLCWNEDGAKGPDDPNNSEAIIVRWLITEGNYAKFRGNAKGQRKTQIADQLARQIASQNVRQHRKPKDVLNKIQYFEKMFRTAYDYTQTETGAGLKENDPKTFEEKVCRMCPYYNELFPVLAARASSRALCTNEDDDSDDTEQVGEARCHDDEDDDDDDEDEVAFVGAYGPDGDVEINCNVSSSARGSRTLVGEANNIEGVKESLLPALEAEANSSVAVNSQTASKKRPTAAKKKNPATLFPSSAKKPKRVNKRDENNQAYLYESMKISQATKAAELKETVRHNRVMEEIQKNEWQRKKDQLDYKKKLVSTYMNLRSSKFDHDYIAHTFPELIQVFPMHVRAKYSGEGVARPPVDTTTINVEAEQEETSELSDS